MGTTDDGKDGKSRERGSGRKRPSSQTIQESSSVSSAPQARQDSERNASSSRKGASRSGTGPPDAGGAGRNGAAVGQAGAKRGPPPLFGAPARRLLEVEVVEAAGLLGVERGGVSNPRVIVFLVNLAGREEKSEGSRPSPVESGKTNPHWKFVTVFGRKINLSQSGNLPTLRVQVCTSWTCLLDVEYSKPMHYRFYVVGRRQKSDAG